MAEPESMIFEVWWAWNAVLELASLTRRVQHGADRCERAIAVLT